MRGFSGGPVIVEDSGRCALRRNTRRWSLRRRHSVRDPTDVHGASVGAWKIAPLRAPSEPTDAASGARRLRLENQLVAIERLVRQVDAQRERDPIAAALCAADAVQRMADYLVERELERPPPDEGFEAKLQRLIEKGPYPNGKRSTLAPSTAIWRPSFAPTRCRGHALTIAGNSSPALYPSRS